jgi:hypothetical protein
LMHALQVSRLIPDTPAHGGVERDRAKVQSGPGGESKPEPTNIAPMRDMGAERRRIFLRDIPLMEPRRQRPVTLAGPLIRGEDGRMLFVLDRGRSILDQLDDDLEPVLQTSLTNVLPSQSNAYERVRVLPDLRVVVLGLDYVACADANGSQLWRWHHPSWPKFVGGDALVVGESIVVVTPTRPAPSGYGQVPAARLTALDPSNGSKIRQLQLNAEEDSPEGFHAIARPDLRGGGIDAGYGQDGSEIWRVAITGQGGIEVTKMDTIDRVLSDISPSGDELLTTPLDSEHLAIFRWTDLAEIAVLRRADVFDVDADEGITSDSFDFDAWYLGADHILARTRQGRLLGIERNTMTARYQLAVDGFDVYGYNNRGKRVDDPSDAFDFESDISGVTVLSQSRIVVQGRNGRGQVCDL